MGEAPAAPAFLNSPYFSTPYQKAKIGTSKKEVDYSGNVNFSFASIEQAIEAATTRSGSKPGTPVSGRTTPASRPQSRAGEDLPDERLIAPQLRAGYVGTSTDEVLVRPGLDLDTPPIRQLRLTLGKTRTSNVFAPTFYVPEDIFVDDDKNAVVQPRDETYAVTIPTPASTYYERRRRRRNSLDEDSNSDDDEYLSAAASRPEYDAVAVLQGRYYARVQHSGAPPHAYQKVPGGDENIINNNKTHPYANSVTGKGGNSGTYKDLGVNRESTTEDATVVVDLTSNLLANTQNNQQQHTYDGGSMQEGGVITPYAQSAHQTDISNRGNPSSYFGASCRPYSSNTSIMKKSDNTNDACSSCTVAKEHDSDAGKNTGALRKARKEGDAKQDNGPPEMLGCPRFRRNLCSALIAPFWFCWPKNRTAREAAAFFIYYVICNLGFFLAIVIAPPTPAPWIVAVLAVPTVMAIIRFSAAVLALVFGHDIKYTRKVKGHVLMMVPCYTEGRQGLSATLDSMAGSDLRGLRGTIVAVCDGRVVGVGATESCEECLTSMMNVERTSVYSDYTEYFGTYKGMNMFVVAKHQNAGKRDSQIRVFKLINQQRFGKVDYIFMTDADCYFRKDSVYQLCWRLSIERDTYAACGDIRVAEPKNILSKGQTYEYFLSQFHSRVAESYFATVTCLPGAFVAITTDVLTPELIRLYSAEPNSLHTAQLLKLGEDRYMTSLFMKLFPRRRAVFLPEAVLHTGVPETSTILKSQRRRWCMSAFHNMFGMWRIFCACFP